ncbi:hypothetical protein AAMO2058_000230000 [Amorphochlora amoebiformis]
MKRDSSAVKHRKLQKSARRRIKPNETPNPFSDIARDLEDWTSQRFAPASPAKMVPISPTSSPAMPVTKEKVQLPGVSCSPLSPLPQGLMEGGGPGTPPTYITLDSMQVQGSSFGVKLQAYDAKTSNVRSMGSLASFHEKRNGRQVEVQFTMGIVGFTSSQRKDKKQIQDAIEERMAQLRKIVQDDDPLPDLEVQEVTKKEKTEKHKKVHHEYSSCIVVWYSINVLVKRLA